MLDINLFRKEKGNDPEIIRESQRRRFASIEVVDEIIKLDEEWRKRKYRLFARSHRFSPYKIELDTIKFLCFRSI